MLIEFILNMSLPEGTKILRISYIYVSSRLKYNTKYYGPVAQKKKMYCSYNIGLIKYVIDR